MMSSKIAMSENRFLSPSCSYDDHGDRKALLQLEVRLLRVQQKATPLNSSPKYKQLPISNYCTGDVPTKKKFTEKDMPKHHNKKSTSSRKRKGIDNNENQCNKTTITTWFSKKPKEMLKNQNEMDKKQILDKNCKKNKEPEIKSGERIFKRNSSGSFDKYGMHLPSFEDILESRKKYKMHEEFLERLGEMNCSQESLDLNIDKPFTPKVLLDCKHLTKDDLIKAFDENRTYISNIIRGTEYSSRHERFYNENPAAEQFTSKDLKYNPSTLCYTYDQKEVLLDLLFKTFDEDSDLGSNNQYFFKVLLPELCLRIFMDVHNMDYDEANTYLEDRPLEELSF